MSKFESSPVTREFQHQIQTYLSEPDSLVVAGISGGPDSMVLLYLLHRLDIETIAIHCNYQLRGEASDRDQKLVEDICQHWNIDCVSISFDSKKESEGFNFQDWARRRRYQAFEDIKNEYGADYILTAHHEDDQVETILQKILRGSGIASWKGMNVSEGGLLRPFLNISKSAIMEFVQEFNVPYRIDRTNEESTYARNFIRNHWFPDFNRLFPGWKENVKSVSERAEEFQVMTEYLLNEISEGVNQLNREKFLKLPNKVQPALFLEFIKKSRIDVEISKGFLTGLDELKQLNSGGKIQLSSEYYILRDRDILKLVENSDSKSFEREITPENIEDTIELSGFRFTKQKPSKLFSEKTLNLDFSTLKFPITLRTWNSGDTFQPFGMKGSQLVSDHLTNRKISSDTKKSALVLESFDGTICAVIFPANFENGQIGTISEHCRCSSKTKSTLTIRKVD